MRLTHLTVVFAAFGLLAGCSANSIVERLNPYRIDVRQGNYVDQEMVAQLRRGMTREQVRFLLGTPLVVDMFRNDRWDYVYVFAPGRGQQEQRVLSVFFEGDRLDRLEGDIEAGDAQAEAEAARGERGRVIDIEAPAGKK
ncbi:outer membrane protein assembly factor BamE [Pseudothauera nasutitermitis]|uniref:Outer membrane protein assembly factor BamE n=1 Tax=Pseudothauera nasutitermitis TaxID=2565930 RepID=A0A4S4B2W8_9RHOO|nr:outer membrane protein assembly factor BamE [Pseudothauera nasutitermitis]THF66885.1 outer membrane protein assembly factor BamE [Pseudothauera nasutitermitis]